jgi:hypothetical protein
LFQPGRVLLKGVSCILLQDLNKSGSGLIGQRPHPARF